MSFANVRLYSAVLPPPYKRKGDDITNTDDAALNGDDPNNREAIRKAMFDIEDE